MASSSSSSTSNDNGTNYPDLLDTVDIDTPLLLHEDAKREGFFARQYRRLSAAFRSVFKCGYSELESGIRTVSIGRPHADPKRDEYCDNYVTTSKYNVFTFVPKNLIEQFSRLANVYFLLISSIQVIPGLSPTGRFTTLVPLIIVLTITAVKEAWEDVRRHRQDAAVNSQPARVYRPSEGAFVQTTWREVRVGDVVLIRCGEYVPADVVLLSTDSPHGTAYVETSQLDGETNLKPRESLEETRNWCTPEGPAYLPSGSLVACETPNNRIHTFEGYLEESGVQHQLTAQHVLLRGCCLRNTGWACGVAVYTGHDTKLMRNQRAAPHKQSRLELAVNKTVLALFVAEVLLAAVCTAGSVVWRRKHGSWYLGGAGGASVEGLGLRNLLTFVILFNNLIPISLYITLELCRVVQAYFIDNDDEMVHRDCPAQARTSDLNEELGQVECLFADKTGTLTQNIMEFRSCSVAGVVYPTQADLARAPPAARPAIDRFLRVLALCHTVVPERDPADGTIAYRAASPDEGALVKAAAELGYRLVGRSPRALSLRVTGNINTGTNSKSKKRNGSDEDEVEVEYELLNVLEFTSARKRMSVVVRDPRTGEILLLCKGADTVIYERLRDDKSGGAGCEAATTKHLRGFATEGLRTLCLAYRRLDPAEYAEWSAGQEAAANSIGAREEELARSAERIERGLTLLGATAIEDKLQDGVPETIETLSAAGIKIWMLTGDKQETAVNIAYSCRLFRPEMRILELGPDLAELMDVDHHSHHSSSESEKVPLGLVIDSVALERALGEEKQALFCGVALRCAAVVCCRCTPLQKAQVVRMVRARTPAVTLAVGDGANDVNMIQSAHVGVGISGEEGLQAARSSDYAIAQFRFLKKLLLVHGRYSYRRLGVLVLYIFYRNLALYLTQFWYVFLNGFSGQSLFEQWTLAMYNILFTFAPGFVFGIMDRDYLKERLYAEPQLYSLGQRREVYNWRTVAAWIGNSVLHSLLCFFVPYFTYRAGVVWENGLTNDIFSYGHLIYSCVVVVVTLKIALETCSWTVINHAAYWGSLALYVVWVFVYGVFWRTGILELGKDYYLLGYLSAESPVFWLTLVVTPVLCLLRDLVWKSFSNYRKGIY